MATALTVFALALLQAGSAHPQLRALREAAIPAAVCSAEGDNCRATGCCQEPGHKCFAKDDSWATCRPDCTAGEVYVKDPVQFRTPWSCSVVAPAVGVAAPLAVPEVVLTDAAPAQSPAQPPVPLAWADTHCDDSNDGVTGPLRIQGLEGGIFAQGGGGQVAGGQLTLHHNAGYSVMSTCRKNWAPDEFVQLKLIGRTISFQVDLSKVGCACNLAFYLVSSGAVDASGSPSKGECAESPYYCDANKVCGQWCPEIDIMEANNHVFQATPHSCDDPNAAGHYSSCDRSGCAQNTKDMPGTYGPGASFTIDTRFPFNVSTRFAGQGEMLTAMVTTLRQGAKEAVLNHANCEPSYLAQVGKALAKGMSLRITYWGSDAKTMAWMDEGVCGAQTCDGSNAGDGVFSAISVDPPQPGAPTRPIPAFQPLPPPAGQPVPVPQTPAPPVPQSTAAPQTTPVPQTTPAPQTVAPQTVAPQTPAPQTPAPQVPTTTWPLVPVTTPAAVSSVGELGSWPFVAAAVCGGLLLLYPLAICLLWCFPALAPASGYNVTRGDSLYASGASSRQLLARRGSTMGWAVDEVNRSISRAFCCCRRPTAAPRAASQAQLGVAGQA